MNKVSRPPLRVIVRRQPPASVLRAPAAVGLALALLASLVPLGTVARAQAVAKKGQEYPVAERQLAYVIYQTPEGETACRLATPDEIAPAGDGVQQLPVRQINHLDAKESVGALASESVGASASAGLTIILRATARLEANPEAKQAFIKAAAKWEELISSQITVTIDVDYGPDFFGNTNQPYGSDTLGATSQGGFAPPYSDIRQRLINRAALGSEEATLLNNLPASSLPTDIGNVTQIFVPSSVARALGAPIPNEDSDNVRPKIGFNTNFPFDLNTDDGLDPTKTIFDSVAVHEIGHALGFNSFVGARELSPSDPLLATVWDIYRFRPGAGTAGTFSSAPRVLSSGTSTTDAHVHFNGSAVLALSTGKPDGTGGDARQASHWKDDAISRVSPSIGIMDPTISRGRHETISANDIRAIDFFGYSVGAIPVPPNDNFASAQALSGSAGRVTGTNRGATREPNEPNHSGDQDDAGGRSVWYTWTAPSSGSVTFNTGAGAAGEPPSNFDTTLAAYTGTSVGALTAIAKNDDIKLGEITTSSITFNAVGGTTYRIAVDGYDGDVGNIALNWSHTGTGGGQPSAVAFSSHAYTASETSGAAVITLGRSNPGTTFSVGVRTIDDPAAVACNDTTTRPGVAFARCDYATTVETVTFGPNDTTRTISIPLVDDSHGEPNETVQIELFNVPPGVQVGVIPVTTLTITSNEAQGQDGPNPLDGVPFFVRMQYLDFLSREPEPSEPWSGVLNRCANQFNTDANSSSAGCDRIIVSQSFFQSQEFQLKGIYTFLFYRVAFNRRPTYEEITPDMRSLAGATAQEVFAARAAYATSITQRPEFAQLYGTTTNQQYVDTLLNRYGLQQITTEDPANFEGTAQVTLTRQQLVSALNGGTLTRAQVLRAIVQSSQVDAAEYLGAFVSMQYYGYLRRTPEQSGYEAWLRVITQDPNNIRVMVNGFMNSQEYRLRFGKP